MKEDKPKEQKNERGANAGERPRPTQATFAPGAAALLFKFKRKP